MLSDIVLHVVDASNPQRHADVCRRRYIVSAEDRR